MANPENCYHLETDQSPEQVQYFFVSTGVTDVVKAIRYRYALPFDGKDVYNLGFGDYDIDSDHIDDTAESNNGDVYKIFHTVLSTVPLFFQSFANTYLIVAGSDGAPEFKQRCQPTCARHCADDQCRKFKRRISVYRHFVDKHLDELAAEYEFFGGILMENGSLGIEPYEKYKKYDAVLISRQNL